VTPRAVDGTKRVPRDLGFERHATYHIREGTPVTSNAARLTWSGAKAFGKGPDLRRDVPRREVEPMPLVRQGGMDAGPPRRIPSQ
jgi:hypothetical protein